MRHFWVNTKRMPVNRTTWLWPFVTATFLLCLIGITPSQAQNAIASRVAPSSLSASPRAHPSALVNTSARIKSTPAPAPQNATLVGKQSQRAGVSSVFPSGSQDDPYTNYRLADHYLRSATVLIDPLPSHHPYLRLRPGANPSSPRDPPFLLT